MPGFRALDVRDCFGTLWAFYREYASKALASFEGDLSALCLGELEGASTHETLALRRQTLSPVLDFCIVPVNDATLHLLNGALSKRGVLGKSGAVIHTQIEVHGSVVFSAYDNFHSECTVASTFVPESLLSALKEKGLLRAYSVA